MTCSSLVRAIRLTGVSLALLAATACAQGAAPVAPAPAAPPSPVSAIRGKLSAGDLLSAESILEVHRARNGEDGGYLAGLSWLARGALLVGDRAAADRYAADTRARCAALIAKGTDPAADASLELALGAAIEVRAQLLQRERGERRAADYVRGELARLHGPVGLVARVNKRLDLLTLTGTAAPELEAEDFVGAPPPTLAALRGQPVLLFVWAEGCGDCRAQAAALARVKARHADRGLRVVALTRYYGEAGERLAEKARVDSVWRSVYADVGTVPIVISTASMERYGGSSTPTFVFVDRAGVVRDYTPTRLTESELDRRLAAIVR